MSETIKSCKTKYILCFKTCFTLTSNFSHFQHIYVQIFCQTKQNRQNSCKLSQRFLYFEWDHFLALKKNLSCPIILELHTKAMCLPREKFICFRLLLHYNPLSPLVSPPFDKWTRGNCHLRNRYKNICSFHLFFWQTNDRCLQEQVMKDQSSILSQVHCLISREFLSNP